MNDRERKDNDLGMNLELDTKGLTSTAAKPQSRRRRTAL